MALWARHWRVESRLCGTAGLGLFRLVLAAPALLATGDELCEPTITVFFEVFRPKMSHGIRAELGLLSDELLEPCFLGDTRVLAGRFAVTSLM